jgi:hypothetical protein
MAIKPLCASTVCLAVVLCMPMVIAVAGTHRIASPPDVVRDPAIAADSSREGKKETATQRDPWPAGVLALLNDPLRTYGWNWWFSETPSDVDTFAFELRYGRDVEHLIGAFGAIKSEGLVLELDPGEAGQTDGGQRYGAQFRIGDQTTLNRWFARLPIDAQGIRTFGLHRLTEPPRATPPTLTLYVGHASVDLEKLDVPLQIAVRPAFSEAHRQRHKDDPKFKAIDAFVARHAARQTGAKPAPRASEQPSSRSVK